LVQSKNVVLYGHERWSLTLREERWLKVSENGEWRKHSEELNQYSSPNIISVIKSGRMRWAGHVARRGKSRGAYRVLVEKPEGKRSLGRRRRRWEDDMKVDLKEVVWWAWTGLIWFRVVTSGGHL